MRAWLRAPVAMTRLTLFLVTGLIGTVAAAGVVAGATALRHAAAERDRAIAQERITVGDVKRIAGRVVRLQSPTRRELLLRIEAALKTCLRDPHCAGALRGAATGVDRPATGVDRPATAGAIAQRHVAGHRRRATAPLERRKTLRRDRSDGSGSSGDTSPGPAGPGPRPPLNLQTPPQLPGPHLCTPLVGINCDRPPG